MGSFYRSLVPSFEATRTDLCVAVWLVLTPLSLIHVSTVDQGLALTHVYNVGLYLIGAAIAYHDRTVRRLLIIASVAGVVELLGDHFLVMIGSLVYPHFVAELLSSPLYMPLSWAIAISQIGYIAYRLDEIYGRRAAIIGPSVGAMLLIGFYESFAKTAGIWEYVFAPFAFIGGAPVYIVAAEGLMFATLIFFIRRDWPAPVSGLGFGVVINLSYVLSYAIFSSV